MYPLIFVLVALLVLLTALCCAQDVVRELLAPRLTARQGTTDLQAARSNPPLVSVIIPARNEAARIGACLDGLTQQTLRRFEVIVVDDDSADGTGDLARSYADALPALTVLRGATLPDGWAGKCWACWQGAARAQGEWLLFLDADVAPLPALIGALVGEAETMHTDAITLLPLLRLGSWAEKLVQPAFVTILLGIYPLRRVNDPATPLAFTNGQCVFVRRNVYAAVDGHRAVRGEVLEDVYLGQRIKDAGYRLHAAFGQDVLAVRMYTDWTSVAEGFGKNAVAGYQSGGARSALVGARQSLVAFGSMYVLLGGVLAWWAAPGGTLAVALLLHGAALWLLTSACHAWLFRRRHRLHPLWGALYPLGLALYFGVASWALVQLWRGQGVVWKGRRFYR